MKKVKSFNENGNIILDITVNDGVIQMNGNKSLISFVEEYGYKMSLGDLLFRMSDIESDPSPDPDDKRCQEFLPGVLKRMPVKYKSKDWNVEVARRTLTKYMNALGFYFVN